MGGSGAVGGSGGTPTVTCAQVSGGLCYCEEDLGYASDTCANAGPCCIHYLSEFVYECNCSPAPDNATCEQYAAAHSSEVVPTCPTPGTVLSSNGPPISYKWGCTMSGNNCVCLVNGSYPDADCSALPGPQCCQLSLGTDSCVCYTSTSGSCTLSGDYAVAVPKCPP